MRAPVLLNLLNKLQKSDKMLGKPRILSLLLNSLNMSTHVIPSIYYQVGQKNHLLSIINIAFGYRRKQLRTLIRCFIWITRYCNIIVFLMIKISIICSLNTQR